MSFKDESGKPLKGVDPEAGGFRGVGTSGGGTFANAVLEGAIIYGTMADDLAIGTIQPAAARFMTVEIGIPNKGGGAFLAYGTDAGKDIYDEQGEVVGRTGGDRVEWNPDTAVFDVQGKLSVRDAVEFGNIQILGNSVTAVRKDDIHLVPSNTGKIIVDGDLIHGKGGVVELSAAKRFFVESHSTSLVNARNGNTLSTDRGDISLLTDNRAELGIQSIKHTQRTTRTDIISPLKTVDHEEIIDSNGTNLVYTKTTTLSGVIREIETTRKTKTVKDGQPATKTVITTTTIATDGTPTTINFTTVTIDPEIPPDLSIMTNGTTVHSAIITTNGPHGLFAGDTSLIENTSYPQFNSQNMTVANVPANDRIQITVPEKFIDVATSGTLSRPREGSIYAHASRQVNFNTGVPLTFGPVGSGGPEIIADNSEQLSLKAETIHVSDPIPLIGTDFAASHSGIAAPFNNKVSFFGRTAEKVFKWIPDATIVSTPNGKIVTGAPGTIEAGHITTRSIKSPVGDLVLEAATGGSITFASQAPITLNAPLSLGENTGISKENGDLRVTSDDDIILDAGGDIRIPCGKQLVFCDNATLSSTPEGGLTLSSTLPVNVDTTLRIGDTHSIALGSTAKLSADVNGSISMTGTALRVPEIVKIGDTVTLQKTIDGDFQIASSTGNVLIDPLRGQLRVSAVQTIFPDQSQLIFGDASIEAKEGDITLNSGALTLNASDAVVISGNTPLQFGSDSTSIQKAAENGKLYILNGTNEVVIGSNTVIDGNLIVNGTFNKIQGTTTTLQNPFIVLGAGDAEHIKDRGVQFHYGTGLTGFIGYSQTTQRFYMVREGTNNADIVSRSIMGDLDIRHIYAESLNAPNIVGPRFQGDPDLQIVGRRVLFDATEYVRLPASIPLQLDNNSIIGYPDRLDIDSNAVNIVQGQIRLGSTVLSNLEADDVLSVSSTIKAEAYALGLNTRFEEDDAGTLQVTAPQTLWTGALTISEHFAANSTATVAGDLELKSGLVIGDARGYWDPVDRLVNWNNTSFRIDGSIMDAEWKGDPIGMAYGGTGSSGPWHERSIIFIDNDGNGGTKFQEDPQHLNYHTATKCLGVRTNSQSSALSIGNGDLEFMDAQSRILFNSGEWTLSTRESTFCVTSSASSDPYFQLTSDGRVGLGYSIIDLAADYRLQVNGDCFFSAPGTGIAFPHAHVSSTGTGLHLISQRGIELASEGSATLTASAFSFTTQGSFLTTSDAETVLRADTISLFAKSVRVGCPLIFEHGPYIESKSGDRLDIVSEYELVLQAPHVVIPHRLCFNHNTTTRVCTAFLAIQDQHLQFVNNAGDIKLDPIQTVHIPEGKSLAFGETGTLKGVNGTLIADFTHAIRLSSDHIGIGKSNELKIDTSGPGTSISTTKPLALNTPSVTLPDNTALIFGDASRRIESDGDSLFIHGGDLITLDANNVRLTGNLIVDKTSTFTIESETSFDSGVLHLGGGQIQTVTDIFADPDHADRTQVIVAADHRLRPGDKVTISDTIPNVDGEYIITAVPNLRSFTIEKVYPGIVLGATVQGRVRTVMVENNGMDAGIEVGWHTGEVPNVDGARTAFYGFDRSTLRWTFIPEATRSNNTFSGARGDLDVNAIYAPGGISASKLLSSLDAGTQLLSGTNFDIAGGRINGTSIGLDVPAEGQFTRLRILDDTLIQNLNADRLDGFHADAFILRDGSTPLLADWYAGPHVISSAGFKDTSLQPYGIVFPGADGRLTNSFNDARVVDGTFIANRIGGFTLTGTLIGNDQEVRDIRLTESTLTDTTVRESLLTHNRLADSTATNITLSNSTFTGGLIDQSNIRVPAGNSLNIETGELLLRDGQISGNKLAGGIGSIDISGNAGSVTNGLYRHDFEEFTILKADANGAPEILRVPPNSFVGRLEGGIQAFPIQDILDKSTAKIYVANSILKADSDKAPEALVIPEKTLVGRLPGGEIDALNVDQLKEMLEIHPKVTAEVIYEVGGVLRDGHRTHIDGAKMTGLMFSSHERFAMTTNQTRVIDVNVETTYLTVHYAEGHHVAYCSLGDGLADGHRKLIVASSIAESAVLVVYCHFATPNNPDPRAFVFNMSGQSAYLQWDTALEAWIVVGSGAFDITRDHLSHRHWYKKFLDV